MPRPVSITFGKMRLGSLVSSAMLTESSKPTIAKKASEVAVLIASRSDLSSGVSNATTREKSAWPPKTAKKQTKITSSRPDSSIRVSTTLRPTLSATPRRFTSAMQTMKISAMLSRVPAPSPRPKPIAKLLANAPEAAEAEVIPLAITVKQTRKVTKWIPNALCA